MSDLFTTSTIPRGVKKHSPVTTPIRTFTGERFVGKTELRQLTSISPQHIDRLEKAGLFPQRVRLGPGRVAWVYSEVGVWMDDKIAGRVRDWAALRRH
ncbi:AlpA family phage regulatory protein [Mesorhizobium sp. M1300]|uniref:helix-turn-helix transcriptional regulator n=1 Tax=Mesorhizobium sp. M1300 TaxID=2957077 RepID=UPI00333C7D04